MKILEPFPYRDNFTGKTVTGKRVVTEWEEEKKSIVFYWLISQLIFG